MSDNAVDMNNTFRSSTGANELEVEALVSIEKDDLIGAFQKSELVVELRSHHADIPPYVCSIDIANSHTSSARVLQKIMVKLGGANEILHNKYRAKAANSYYEAWKINRTEEAWNLFVDV
mmetsp:Transcript_3581/g.4044  ORF Transcript_3581/g.4044 Transcript_3581/m.4044 type:complete len:120 (-) Transcript_3581:104-463(-)